MEYRDIEIFLTVAEELHFGRTAERLTISTARVSQAIKKLERRIGAALFERTSRQVALTPIGAEFRAELEPAYRQVNRALENAIAAGRGVRGVMHVGYLGPAAGRLLLATVDVFAMRYPECEVRIREVQNSQGVAPLRAGEVDMLVQCFPFDEPDLVSGRPLIREPRMVAVSHKHPFARRERVSLEDLAEDKLITAPADPDAIPEYHWEQSRAPRLTPTGRPIERGPVAATFQEMLALSGAGKGIVVVGAQTAHYFPRPDVAYVPLADAPLLCWGLIWRASGQTARVLAFNEAAEHISRTLFPPNDLE